MSTITTIKNDIKGVLTAHCGVPAASIHMHASVEKTAFMARKFPVIGLIAADEKFTWTISGACNTFERVVPIEVRVYHSTEVLAMGIVDTFIAKEGTLNSKHEIVSIAHSDHLAQVTQYYAAFIVIKFSLLY